MKAIIINEELFEQFFQQTLDKLKLERFQNNGTIREEGRFENSPVGDLHRTFVSEIVQLKERLKKHG